MIKDFGEVVLNLLDSNKYTMEQSLLYFGEDIFSAISSYINTGWMSEESYIFFKKILAKHSISDFFQSLDLEQVNKDSMESFLFDADSLKQVWSELEVWVFAELVRYRIYDDILKKNFDDKYTKVAAGESFELYQCKNRDTVHLNYKNQIIADKELFFDDESTGVNQVLFSSEKGSYVYDMTRGELLEFDGVHRETICVRWHNFLIFDTEKTSTVYCIENAFEHTFTADIRWIEDTWNDILIISEQRNIEQIQKDDSDITRVEELVNIYSITQAEQTYSFPGRLAQVRNWKSGICLEVQEKIPRPAYIRWENPDLPPRGFQNIFDKKFYYLENHPSTDRNQEIPVIGHLYKIEKFWTKKEEEKRIFAHSNMETRLLTTDDDIIAFVSFFPANKESSDTPHYNIVSLSKKFQFLNIPKIAEVISENWQLEIHYFDHKGNKKYLNTRYQYDKEGEIINTEKLQ